MHASIRSLSRLVIPALLLAAGACAGVAPPEETEPAAGAVVEVRNLGFADVTVYAMSGTARRVRLGLAGGNATSRFTIPAHLVRGGGTIRFLADPVGGNRAPVSEELTVGPGEEVVLTIPPQ